MCRIVKSIKEGEKHPANPHEQGNSARFTDLAVLQNWFCPVLGQIARVAWVGLTAKVTPVTPITGV